MTKPLASHNATMMARMMPTMRGEPLGTDARGPSPRPPPPPRRPRRPNREPKRLLKSLQTSSRSGGPPCPGRRGGSEPLLPPPLPPPRPQPGSFRLKIFDIKRIVSRNLTSFDYRPTQTVQAGTPQSTYKYSRNGTMF